MELARITANGQITIPAGIRKILNLKDGDKILFIEDNGKVFVENSTKSAITEAQTALKGLAEELGIETEEDAVTLVREIRNESWKKKHADND